MEDDDAEEDEDEGEDVEEDEDEDVNAEDEVEEDKVQDDDVEEEEDDDVGDDAVEEEEDRSQDLGPHCVRACAVKMHVKSTYHKSHFIQKFTGKRRGTRVSTVIKHRPLLLA